MGLQGSAAGMARVEDAIFLFMGHHKISNAQNPESYGAGISKLEIREDII